MELIRISDSKLKVMLSADDMRQYDLDCDSLDYDSTKARRAFWSILDDAHERTGFDAADGKMYVQMYPSKCGGCELFVTRLSLFYKSETGTRTGTAQITESADDKSRFSIYKFRTLGELLRVCARLAAQGFSAGSAAYADRVSDACFLLLEERGHDLPSALGGQKHYCFIGEYNGVLCKMSAYAYIGEYCACICETDAVHTLAELL